MSSLQGVFFDFGDTLAELSPSREELFVRSALSIGLTLQIELVRRAYQTVDFHHAYSSLHVTDRDRFYSRYNEELCVALGISSHARTLCPVVAAQFRSARRWVLVEDARQTLERLRWQNVTLGLIANWDSDLPSLTERLGIRQYFAAIVPSQSAGVEKPDPVIFRRAAESLGLSAARDRILHVGNDYRADVMGSRVAGLTPVLIDRTDRYPHADCARFPSLGSWLASIE